METETQSSEEERELMRRSVRGFLEEHWPAPRALSASAEPVSVCSIWKQLCALGIGRLGADRSVGGLREALLVIEELGRAACPAPMLDAAVTNILLHPIRDTNAEIAALLDQLHAGDALVSIAFGLLSGDPNAGTLRIEGDRLSGRVSFVELATSATHLLAGVSGGHCFSIVRMTQPRLSVIETPGFAVPPLSDIVADGVTLDYSVSATPEQMADLELIARLGFAARALGAAQRAFELALDHAKTRRQFGEPIGKFQAIQHKLANCAISLDGTRLTIENASAVYDLGSQDWRVFASSAFAFASSALRQVSLETHHAFGAIGYSEEHEAPRHFRRVHSDLVRHGGVRRAREELAAYLLKPNREREHGVR